MGKLQVLPAQIANMIAAGEVVQRPSSVVKELMENAVDAGATQVSVVLTDSGRTLIQVIDNGCGMSEEDAKLCFERHATSKIASAEDLEAILTYGFRGEALASIAAVAEVELKTRKAGEELGTRVTVGEFGALSVEPVSCAVGANFAVRNLFYNTPARRKFLKSDNVELKHIVEEFLHVALTRPEIGFSLSNNGRDMFVLGKAKSLKFRILDLLGSNVVGDVVDLEADTSLLKVHGYIGRPQAAKKTLGNQFLFVNGRYFRSAYLHKAIMNAYEEMTPEGLTPSYFIYLEVDPHSVDVNISPTKTEIKFEEDSVIFQVLYACVRETLGRNAFGAGIDFDTEGALPLPQVGKSFDEYRGAGISPAVDFDPSYNPFAEELANGSATGVPVGGSFGGGFSFPGGGQKQDFSALFGDLPTASDFAPEPAPAVKAPVIVLEKYVITPCVSGIMIVNIRRAQERISFERALRALDGGDHVTQTSLFPVQVQVGVAQRLLFDENADLLQSLGFDITPFGTDSVVVNGVPEGYSCEEGPIRTMVSDIMLILSERGKGLDEVMKSAMAQKFALLSTANLSVVRSTQEAQLLLDTLFACDNSELTSGGKRITCVISVEDIDKKF